MRTASFYTTAHKMILAILRANRDGLRVYDTHGWRALTDEELQRLDHAKASDVSCEGDLDDFDMFDGCWRAGVLAWTADSPHRTPANTAYPACSSRSTARPYGRRCAPDLTC